MGYLRNRLLWVLALALLALPARADLEQDTLDALEPYRGRMVVELRLQGHTVTRDYVISREIWVEPGMPLNPDLAAADAVRLENLGLFGRVAITAADTPGGIILSYDFEEIPSLVPFPVISYTEENGFSFGAGVASTNFQGRGMTLAASAAFGGVNSWGLFANNPWLGGNHRSVTFQGGHAIRRNELLEFEQTQDQIGLAMGRYLGQTGRLRLEGAYQGVGSDEPGRTLDPDNYDVLYEAGVFLGLDTRDSWRVPHQGWLNEIGVSYWGGKADSRVLTVDLRRFQPLADRHTLALGALLNNQSGEVGTHLPSYLQYFLGGANTIRGYTLQDLGPTLYGRNQLLYSMEYRYLLRSIQPFKVFKWSLGVGLEAAAFGDIGVAWSQEKDLNMDRARSGYGAGFRVLLPGVGSLRFDVGISQYGDPVFNFGAGSIFGARRARDR